MKKEKILRINTDLKFDTRYVFNLKRNCSFQVFAKNVSFRIRTNQFGLAMHCFGENRIKKTHEYNWRRTGSAFSIITNDCNPLSFNAYSAFNKYMSSQIKAFLAQKLNIRKALANRNTVIANTDLSTTNTKSLVNLIARSKSKLKVHKLKFRTFSFKNITTISQYEEQITRFIEYQNLYLKKFAAVLLKLVQCNMLTLDTAYECCYPKSK